MRALTITNKKVCTDALLKLAEETPGAWVGIRIAAIILVLEGFKSTAVAKLFGLSRWSIVKWIGGVNHEGERFLIEKHRSGRRSRIDGQVRAELASAVMRSPMDFGINRRKWDGRVVSEYLKRVHGITIKVRQSQRWLLRLGFTLQRPMHKYAQGLGDDVGKLRKVVKKTHDGMEKRSERPIR